MESNPKQPEHKKPGPKPKLEDPGVRLQIYQVLTTGGSRADAARSVGVSVKTVYNESQRDPEFYRGLRKAEVAGKIHLIDVIGKAAAADWRAAAWMLERKYHREWSNHARNVLVREQVDAKIDTRTVEVQSLREQILQDRDYLEWLRHRALQQDRQKSECRSVGRDVAQL